MIHSTGSTHSLERTNPKGQDFIGRCVLCGLENLKMTAAQEPCTNPKGVTPLQSLLDAIDGP